MLYDSFLIIISGYQWWDLSWHTVFIQGNENKIAAGDFAYFAGYRVLGGNLDTNFHACATGIMDFTVHRDDISDECRCKEIKAFYTYCNRGTVAMLNCNDSGSLVYHTHNDTTMYIPHIVGIAYFHKASRSGTRVGNALSLRQINFGKIAKSISEAVEWIHVFL